MKKNHFNENQKEIHRNNRNYRFIDGELYYSWESEYLQNWKDRNFTYQEAKSWIRAGLTPRDYDFAHYLKKDGYQPSDLNKNNLEELRKKCSWQDIREDFNFEKRKNWEEKGFTIKQTKQLIATGITINSDGFVYKKHQLKWIPYKLFANINYLAKGGFSKVFKAEWQSEELNYGEFKIEERKRRSILVEVVLKSINNSQNITAIFLQEVINHKILEGNRIVKCHGISQDPITKNYVVVMDYMKDGSLRKYLDSNYNTLEFIDKIRQLLTISEGLKSIHEKNLIHQDFHSGNILNYNAACWIADLGLCCPIIDEGNQKKVYGVMPYVAPEVLRNKPYTPASDIYSFGIVAYETLTGLPPYYDLAHEDFLALEICRGLRPQFQIKIPQLLEDLVKRCWDANPNQRPTANELHNFLNNWYWETMEKNFTEFYRQVNEAEKFNTTLPKTATKPSYKLHPSAIYTSRLLDFKNLPEPQNSKEVNEVFYKLKESGDLDSLRVDKFNAQGGNVKIINSSETVSDEKQILIAESEEIPPIEIKSEELKNASTNSWQNIHPGFTSQLTQSWQNLNFNYQQTQDWINIGLNPHKAEFANWLKNEIKLSPEELLNDSSRLEDLKEQFLQSQLQAQIIQANLPPKNN